MKNLLIVSAVIEVGAGAALLCSPSAMVELLLGSPLDASAAVTLGRVAGAALLALGIACWLARCDGQSGAARGLVCAMALYDFCVAVIFGAAGIWSRPVGVAFWPAFVLHGAMTAWCATSLLTQPTRITDKTGTSEQ